jgi:hypothetical protein
MELLPRNRAAGMRASTASDRDQCPVIMARDVRVPRDHRVAGDPALPVQVASNGIAHAHCNVCTTKLGLG